MSAGSARGLLGSARGLLAVSFLESAVRGFHEYQTIWKPKLGELLTTEPDPYNIHDKYAISVKRDHLIVGHIPIELSKFCYFFIKRGGIITVEVVDINRRISDLPQGGLEIPAQLIFVGSEKDVDKLSDLIGTYNE